MEFMAVCSMAARETAPTGPMIPAHSPDAPPRAACHIPGHRRTAANCSAGVTRPLSRIGIAASRLPAPGPGPRPPRTRQRRCRQARRGEARRAVPLGYTPFNSRRRSRTRRHLIRIGSDRIGSTMGRGCMPPRSRRTPRLDNCVAPRSVRARAGSPERKRPAALRFQGVNDVTATPQANRSSHHGPVRRRHARIDGIRTGCRQGERRPTPSTAPHGPCRAS